jgi:hypothetical protein
MIMATPNQRRWQCGHCGTSGWSSDGAVPAHDRVDGRACRPNEHELICSETAYGKTVGYDFFLKVF